MVVGERASATDLSTATRSVHRQHAEFEQMFESVGMQVYGFLIRLKQVANMCLRA